MAVEDTLVERGLRYGDFTDHAEMTQRLQNVMRGPRTSSREHGWDKLSDVQKQALTVIADKIARILTGDPDYADNWHDIQGYARLVEERLDPNFVFGAKTELSPLQEPDLKKRMTGPYEVHRKVVKACCKNINPNPFQEGMVGPYTYCINCGHRYKPGEVQDVGSQT